jgi:lipopolysaccharide/colanic/teichoic acid biosynthesis glycosyltransferase
MYLPFKFVADFVLSILALLILSPLLIPIVIGLLLTGEGYVFYRQRRVGLKNSLFEVYKFATMLKNSPNLPGGAITVKNDPRITPMGGFLRKSKINELPQLLNILKGDMSFVGPRPVMKEQSFDHYPEDVKKVIYNLRPGLTGIGSLIFRDEEDLITQVKDDGGDPEKFYIHKIYPHKGELEKWYQKNFSFWTDFKILFATAWVVIFPKSNVAYKWFKNIPKRNF